MKIHLPTTILNDKSISLLGKNFRYDAMVGSGRFGNMIGRRFFSKFLDFDFGRAEGGTNRLFEAFCIFSGGDSMTGRKGQDNQGLGVVASLFVVGIFR